MTATMPSSSRVFTHSDVASAVTKSALVGRVGSFSRRLVKCFESLMCDWRLLSKGLMKWRMYNERQQVGLSQPKTIERRGQFGLCIFGNLEKKSVRI